MARMIFNTSSMPETSNAEFVKTQQRRIAILSWVGVLAALLFAPTAFAADTSGLCTFAKFLKDVATGAAIIAVVLFVVNSLFMKSSVVGDIILYVIVGCVIVAVAPDVVGMTGLTTSCTF